MEPGHRVPDCYVVGEGIYPSHPDDRHGERGPRAPTADEKLRSFRFSRMAGPGPRPSTGLLEALADAMTARVSAQPDSQMPAGFTYLARFIEHDLTFDSTAEAASEDISVAELVHGRSPALDLDVLYGRGPARTPRYYRDGVHLKVGTTCGAGFPADLPLVRSDMRGFDLPRVGFGVRACDRRQPLIPDPRNDAHLAVAQTHAAFIRFHNRMADELGLQGVNADRLFEKARAEVVRHYQWMIRHDFLPRILDRDVLDAVFENGRRHFAVEPLRSSSANDFRPWATCRDRNATLPIEFSAAAYRLSESMERPAYEWNAVFRRGGPGGSATQRSLRNFTGAAGTLSPAAAAHAGRCAPQSGEPETGRFERLPTSWIADFRRLYDFQTDAGLPDCAAPDAGLNLARCIATQLSTPVGDTALPPDDGTDASPGCARGGANAAHRILLRGLGLALASGQQMADFFGLEPAQRLSNSQIIEGAGGAAPHLTAEQTSELLRATPLWFYVLREAEVGDGSLGPVGSRIVAETFHRALEVSRYSIVRERYWRPSKGPDHATFGMAHLLLFAFEDRRMLGPI